MGYLGDKKQSKSRRSRSVVPLSWDIVPSYVLSILVGTFTANGQAVLFGISSNGGTLSLYVYDDGDKEVYYIRSKDNPVEVAMEVLEDFGYENAAASLKAASESEKGRGKA